MNIYILQRWRGTTNQLLDSLVLLCISFIPGCRATQCALARRERLQDRQKSFPLRTIHVSADHLLNLSLNRSVAFSHAKQTKSSDCQYSSLSDQVNNNTVFDIHRRQ